MTRHGECKTPGGKLVGVDLAVEAGVLAAVRVHGDFFVEPEAAARPTLDAIAAALAGCPADLAAGGLAARVRAAVPFGVELVGTTPEAVAVAVRRAVTGADDAGPSPNIERVGSLAAADIARLTAPWRAYPWRVLPERPLSAAVNVALDEVLADQVGGGSGPPAVRFWRWAEPAVRRLQVAVDHRRRQGVEERHRLGELDERGRRPGYAVGGGKGGQVVDPLGQAAAGDVLEHQPRAVADQVRVGLRHDVRVTAGLHDPVNQTGLADQLPAGVVEAELRRTVRPRVVPVSSQPHFAKPTRPEQFSRTQSGRWGKSAPGRNRGSRAGNSRITSSAERTAKSAGTVRPVGSAGRRRDARTAGGMAARYCSTISMSSAVQAGVLATTSRVAWAAFSAV